MSGHRFTQCFHYKPRTGWSGILLMAGFLLFGVQLGLAQSVSGKVVDQEANPLVGVSRTVAGSDSFHRA